MKMPDQTETEALRNNLIRAMEAANMDAAEAALEVYAALTSHARALTELLEPVLIEIGEHWAAGDNMVLAQGYLAAKLTESQLTKVLKEQHEVPQVGNSFGPVLVGNIEDDFHSLGRKMVATFLRAAGWDVHDLGNDVPAEYFIGYAKETGAKVIGASAMMYTTAKNIKRLREAIDREGLKERVLLAVGGAVFNLRPELTDEVGGDGTARSALLAPELFESLARRSIK